MSSRLPTNSYTPLLSSREEIAILRNAKPQTGERRDAVSIPSPKPMEGESTQAIEVDTSDSPDGTETNTNVESSNGTLTICEETREVAEPESADDDSNEAVGKEEAAEQDRDMMDENDDNDEEIIEVTTQKSTKVTSMFQKIMSLGSQGGQVIMKVGPNDEEKATPPPSAAPGQSALQPTLVHNGRLVCSPFSVFLNRPGDFLPIAAIPHCFILSIS